MDNIDSDYFDTREYVKLTCIAVAVDMTEDAMLLEHGSIAESTSEPYLFLHPAENCGAAICKRAVRALFGDRICERAARALSRSLPKPSTRSWILWEEVGTERRASIALEPRTPRGTFPNGCDSYVGRVGGQKKSWHKQRGPQQARHPRGDLSDSEMSDG
jgi:hypothetical protein